MSTLDMNEVQRALDPALVAEIAAGRAAQAAAAAARPSGVFWPKDLTAFSGISRGD